MWPVWEVPVLGVEMPQDLEVHIDQDCCGYRRLSPGDVRLADLKVSGRVVVLGDH